jgi:phage terminase Nu1 subunit (DNA packaging protein)
VKRILLTKKELLEKLQKDDIKTETGKPMTERNLTAYIAKDKIPCFYKGDGGHRLFLYEEVLESLYPSKNDDIEDEKDEFRRLIDEAIEIGMQPAQYIKAKETYETYEHKRLENEEKRRELIPMQEAREVLEVAITNLKSKHYNIPNQLKSEFPKLEQDVIDTTYTLIDKSYEDIHKNGIE